MRELFIYYRLQSIHAAAAEALVIGFQAQLRKQYPPLIPRLLRRSDIGSDGLQTWMETYSTDPMREPRGVTAELESAIAKLGDYPRNSPSRLHAISVRVVTISIVKEDDRPRLRSFDGAIDYRFYTGAIAVPYSE